jgi:hypothetical protein
VPSDYHACSLGRVRQLGPDDGGESQVTEGATSVPALVTALGEDDLGSR